MSPRPRPVVRRADEPPADLTEHRVLHRAIRVDLRRLASATAAATWADEPNGKDRRRSFDDYLAALTVTTRSHLRVDNDCLAELLTDAVKTVPLDRQIRRLTGALDEIDRVNDDEPVERAAFADGRRLAAALAGAAGAAEALFGAYERVVFPLILRDVRAADYRPVRDRFRADLPPGLLAFVVPWTIRHARPEELPTLQEPILSVTDRIFAHRFQTLEARVFG